MCTFSSRFHGYYELSRINHNIGIGDGVRRNSVWCGVRPTARVIRKAVSREGITYWSLSLDSHESRGDRALIYPHSPFRPFPSFLSLENEIGDMGSNTNSKIKRKKPWKTPKAESAIPTTTHIYCRVNALSIHEDGTREPCMGGGWVGGVFSTEGTG